MKDTDGRTSVSIDVRGDEAVLRTRTETIIGRATEGALYFEEIEKPHLVLIAIYNSAKRGGLSIHDASELVTVQKDPPASWSCVKDLVLYRDRILYRYMVGKTLLCDDAVVKIVRNCIVIPNKRLFYDYLQTERGIIAR